MVFALVASFARASSLRSRAFDPSVVARARSFVLSFGSRVVAASRVVARGPTVAHCGPQTEGVGRRPSTADVRAVASRVA